MKQLVGCLQNPNFFSAVHVRVLCSLENLSYNTCTHQYLCNPEILSTVVNGSIRSSDLEK